MTLRIRIIIIAATFIVVAIATSRADTATEHLINGLVLLFAIKALFVYFSDPKEE